jgi:High potential iron-sulfur protein/Protein of unknown function (DUF2384)
VRGVRRMRRSISKGCSKSDRWRQKCVRLRNQHALVIRLNRPLALPVEFMRPVHMPRRILGLQPPADMKDSAKERERLNALPDVRERVNEMLTAHYDSWATQKIPALNNRRPIDVVTGASGREKVEVLLNQMERDTLRMMPEIHSRRTVTQPCHCHGMKNSQHAVRSTVENQTMPIITRRSLIKATLMGTVAIPLAAQFQRSAHAADDSPPILDVNDPTAKALAYIEDAAKVDAKAFPAYKSGQNCANCSQWQSAPTDKLGGCELVLGQFVRSAGWCKVWEPKPAPK